MLCLKFSILVQQRVIHDEYEKLKAIHYRCIGGGGAGLQKMG